MLSQLQITVYVFANLFSMKIKYPQWYTTATHHHLLSFRGISLCHYEEQQHGIPLRRILSFLPLHDTPFPLSLRAIPLSLSLRGAAATKQSRED